MNKKVWLLILSLCLVLCCTATAMATDVPATCSHGATDFGTNFVQKDGIWVSKTGCGHISRDGKTFVFHPTENFNGTDYHMQKSNNEKGVCEICGVAHPHQYDAKGVCKCGWKHVCLATDYDENGICKVCKVPHNCVTTDWENGTCKVCSKKHDCKATDWANGTCKVCSKKHDCVATDWENGTCKVCSKKHDCKATDWANGICKVCSKKHDCKATDFDYKKQDGICTVCHKKHECTKWTNVYCDTCHVEHKHTTWKYIPAVAATCTKDGLTEGKICDVCGKVLVAQQVTTKPHAWQLISNQQHECVYCNAKADHIFVNGVCTACGDYTCQHNFVNGMCTKCHFCKHINWVNIDGGLTQCAACGEKCNHSAGNNEELIQQGTCTTANVIKLTCKKCGKQTGWNTSTFNHDYQEGMIDATCNNPAMKGSICTKCKAVEPDTVLTVVPNSKPLGHNLVPNTAWRDESGKVIYTAATCDKDGRGYMYCSRCDYVAGVQKINKLGHNWDVTKEVHVAVTCTVNEHWANPCTRCNATNPVRDVEGGKIAQGHKQGTIKIVAPNCCDQGYTEIICSRCNGVMEKTDWTATNSKNHKNLKVQYVLREGSCTEARIEKVKCDCGYEDYRVTPANHTWVKNNDYVAPTCGSAARGTQTCKVCGISVKVNEPATGKHVYAENILKPATCTSYAKVGTFCTVCYAQKPNTYAEIYEEGKPVPHKYVIDYDKEYKAPTCKKEGKAFVKNCETCNTFNYEWITLPATGNHTWGAKQMIPATCTKPAQMAIPCTVCGDLKNEGNDHPEDVAGSTPIAHNYQKFVTEANCQNSNKKTEYKCAACGAHQPGKQDSYEYDKDWQKKHNYKTINVIVSATCKTKGVVKKQCKDCDYTTYGVTSVNHKWDDNTKVVVKPATCGAAGEGKYTCSLCGEVGKYTINATGKHNYQPNQIKPATCAANATVGTYCTVCWANYGSDAQEIKGTKLNHNIVINKDYKDGNGNPIYVAPTCDANGIGYQSCTLCGKENKVVVIPALGHKYGAEILNEEGTALYHECGVCGHQELVKVFDPNADQNDKCAMFGHSETIIPAVEATCTEAGKTAGLKCTVCGKITDAQEEVAAKGHTEVAVPGKAATCTETGLTEGKKCSVCGMIIVEQKEIAVVDHTEVVTPAKAATCTETGLTEGTKCSVCDKVLTAQEEVKALGHKLTKKYSFNDDFTKRVVTTTCERCDYKTVEEEDF